MNESLDKYDIQFYQLVISLQGAAMHQMGKIASPLTGEIERDLDQAQASIELLAMIQRKTEGNLSEDEEKMIDHVLYELRLNFVDESKKGPSEEEAGASGTESESDSPKAEDSSPESTES